METGRQSIVERYRDALVHELKDKNPRKPTRDVDAFMRQGGMKPSAGRSLREIGKVTGLSREGVRNICTSVESAALKPVISGSDHHALRADIRAALESLQSLAPGADAAVSVKLRNQGVLEDKESAAHLFRIAESLGITASVRLVLWDELEAFEDTESPSLFRPLLTFARKVAWASGAVSSAALAARFNQEKGATLTVREVEAMLEPVSEHLTDTVSTVDGTLTVHRWFHFPKSASYAVSRALQTVRALGSASLASLTNISGKGEPTGGSRAVSRSAYLVKLPMEAMEALLRFHGFDIQGDTVSALEGKSPRSKGNGYLNHPSDIKKRMVGLLKVLISRAAEGRVPRKDFVAACESDGLRRATVTVYMYRSGLFVCEHGTCRLATA